MPRKVFRQKANFKKRVLAIVNSSEELHCKEDLNNIDTSVTESAAHTLSLSSFAIAQGTDNDERLGDKIRVKDMNYLIKLFPGFAGIPATGLLARVKVLQYKDASEPSSVSDINPMEFYPGLQTAQTGYKILFDRVFKMTPDGNNEMHYLKVRVDGKRLMHPQYNEGASTVQLRDVECVVTTDTATINQLSSEISGRIRWYD